MIDLGQLTIVELGALICESLRAEGVPTTLSGGACAEIYSNKKYVTGDLDFVVNYFWPRYSQIIERVMSALGFEKKGRIFINKMVAYSVEFPPGPLSVGEDYQIQPVELELKTGLLSLLSPTDSAKDRLAGYFHGNDAQCLEQALMICQMNEVDMDNIRRWATNEGRPDRFKEFELRMSAKTEKTISKRTRRE